MIYDCFTFFNELELLEVRLHELGGVVDKFVLVEATRTHTNQPKPLYYEENRVRFAGFTDKIIHIVVHDLPNVSDPWVLDRFQRNCIARGLQGCRPDDLILISDADEIPRAIVVDKVNREMAFSNGLIAASIHHALNSKLAQNILQRKGLRRLWRKNHPFVWKLQQNQFCYFLNCRSSAVWYGTRMTRFRDFSCAEEIFRSGRKYLAEGGWHFTWMGGADRVLQKLGAIAHQENNYRQFTEFEDLERAINAGMSLFDKNQSGRLEFVTLDNSFPSYVLEHTEKYSNWLRSV